MLYLYLGADDFTKKQKIDSLVKEKRAELVVFGEGDETPKVQDLIATDLFSKPKVFVLSLPPPLGEGKGEGVLIIDKLILSSNHIVISTISLDKRKKENKDILLNKKIIVKEFILPHGQELDKWILERVLLLGGKMSKDAANQLAVRLGRDEAKETKFGGKVVSTEEVFSLWQADSEIKKLIAYSGGREITKEDVSELVSENGEVDALQITNALADKNKELSFLLIQKFLKEQTASDEKGSIIQLNALLSEQFRNVAITQDFANRKTNEAEILEKTGWKSGRLFVMKKISDRFDQAKVVETLSKLASLDEEIKTSQMPPRVLLELILGQLF